jgi:hypothetical protein
MEFLRSLEQSGFSSWVRESPSPLAYPLVLFLHTVGLGFLVGSSMVIDLRVLGFSKDLPLQPMKKFFPIMYAGFWVNALSGMVLLLIDATSMLTNTLFYIKIGFIALAVLSGRMIARQVFEKNETTATVSTSSKAFAVASLAFWAAAITAGRLTAYIVSHSGLSAALNK